MRKDVAVNYFGTQQKLAAKLGITQGAMCSWNPERIPFKRAVQIEEITGGELKVDYSAYGISRQPAQ